MLLTEAEAAKLLRVSKTTLVTNLMRQPDFPVVRLPGVRRVLIPEDRLRAWIEHSTSGRGDVQ